MLDNWGPVWECDMNIKSFFATFHWVPQYTLFVLWATFKESFQKALLSVTGGHTSAVKEHRAWWLCGVWVFAPCLKLVCFSSSDRLSTVSHHDPNTGTVTWAKDVKASLGTTGRSHLRKEGKRELTWKSLLCKPLNIWVLWPPRVKVEPLLPTSWPQSLWNCQPVTWSPQ